MQPLWTLLLLFFLPCFAGAPTAFAEQKPERTHHRYNVGREELLFTVNRYTNARGQAEVSVEHEEIRRLFPDTRFTVLYGRDGDGDGMPDIWFYSDPKGVIETVDLPAKEWDGWDAASRILQGRMKIKNRSEVGLILHGMLSFTFLSVSANDNYLKEAADLQMDLGEMEVHADRLAAVDPESKEADRLYGLVAEGWEHLNTDVKSERRRKVILWGLTDAGSFILGYALIKGIQIPLRWIGPKAAAAFSKSVLGDMAMRMYTQYIAGIADASRKVLTRVRQKKLSAAGGAAATRELAKLSFQRSVDIVLRGIHSRAQITHAVSQGIAATKPVLAAGMRQWKYVLQTQMLQFFAETLSRKQVFDPNPIVLTKNLFNAGREVLADPGFEQNFAYMGAETFLQTAVSSHFSDLRKKMSICAAISFVDSSTVNFALKGDADPVRAGVDTRWEAIVGNAQTQLDIYSLAKFEQLALAKGNGKLRLVGYAIAVVDQFGGYVAYSKLTQWLFEQKGKSGAENPYHLELTPVLAEL